MTHPMLMSKAELDAYFYNWLQPELKHGMASSTFRHLMSLSREQKAGTLCTKLGIPTDPNEAGLASMEFYVALHIAKANEKPCCEFC